MTKILNILIIGLQLGLTFAMTVCIYMIFALMDYEGGFDNFVGLTIFQPIIAITLSVLTIICCFVLGLPIRLIRTLNRWWTKHFFIAISLTIIGLTLLVISMTPQFIELTTVTTNGQETIKSIPNAELAITGWFLTAFSILHIYPPSGLRIKAQNVLTNLTGKKQNEPQQSV